MRASRWAVILTSVGSLVLPTRISVANGGAYLESDQPHVVAGQTGTLRTTVFVSERQEDLFTRGPFYALLTRPGVDVKEGRELPEGTIRLGTFMVRSAGREQFDLAVAFTTPGVASGYYSVWLCNDPCTISGFRDQITGSIRIVATEEEGRLLTRQDQLQDAVRGLRREMRRSDEAATELEDELASAQAQLTQVDDELQQLRQSTTAQARRLAADLERADDRAFAWIWVASILAGVVALLVVLVWRRGRRRHGELPISVPDSPQELDELSV